MFLHIPAILILVLLITIFSSYFARAATNSYSIEISSPQNAIPPNIAGSANKPMLMLTSSKDHTLFAPIYTDYEDIDGDGAIDTAFKPNFKYYGYFDSSKCYAYSQNLFAPAELALKTADGRYTCAQTGEYWSGNFLNWSTTSRVDVIRKMLYGGKRFLDGHLDGPNGVSITILERVNLSKDSHSFVKHYWGRDVRDYTPFTMESLTKSSGSNAGVYAGLTICNRSSEMSSGGTPLIRIAKGNYKMWSTINANVCRWSEEILEFPDGSKYAMAGTFGPKLARYFQDADKGNGGIAHEAELPQATRDGLTYSGYGPDLIARVQACVPGLIGEERCQAFPANSDKNLKPYGLFQEFGLGDTSASAKAEFGLITGSYVSNLQSGVLRKNINDFSDEINPETGVFCHSSELACAKYLSDGRRTGEGAIKSIDAFALYEREYATYFNSLTRLPEDMKNGDLKMWGNPVGEMLVQALNYYAGSAQNHPSNSTFETSAYGIPVADWKDPLSRDNPQRMADYGNSICRPMYALALSSSALSFDEAADADFDRLPNKTRPNLNSYVDIIGDVEGITNSPRSVGSVSRDIPFGNTCAKKTVGKLSDVSGICPEAPALGGTYQVAGASLYANTSKVRDVTALGKLPEDFEQVKDALKVKTMAASLAGGVPRVEIPIPNQPGKFVYITPESVFNADGKMMPGGILSFVSVNSGPLMDASNVVNGSYGAFVVSFNDRLFGGDYDMDVTGFLRYEVTPDPTNGNEYNIKVITDIVNVGGGYLATHGFSIMGVDQDGRYLTHKHDPNIPAGTTDAGPSSNTLRDKKVEGFMCADIYPQPADTLPRGNRCNVSRSSDNIYNEDYRYEMNFKMVGVQDVILHDPLWYAAKYGNFDSSESNPDGTFNDLLLPPNQLSWDKFKTDGSLGSDGIPDGYFLARRPEILEAQLRKALNVVASASNAAPALSSTVLNESALKYSVRFDSSSIAGQLEAYKAKADGSFYTVPTWEAGNKLHEKYFNNQGLTREIITNDGVVGKAFRWDELSPGYQAQLTSAGTNKLSVDNAKIALNYIRGDQTHEGVNGLRSRANNLLGPVVSSSPWIQQRPMASWGGNIGYGDFYQMHHARKNVLWVGANDGMLHAFDAENGDELFAYVPGVLANRLAEIPLQREKITSLNGDNFVTGIQVLPGGTVWPYVDGNPFTADIKVGSQWHTYLFGALGRGGRGVFALDATVMNAMSESNAAHIFKWQFTVADDQDFGYQVSDVKIHLSSNQATPIARLNNGKFAWILGNGQHSLTGKAALFILYADGPQADGNWSGRYRKIVVDAGAGNGLSTPRWEDLNGDGTADVVYAGDIKGNLWKFDLHDPDASKWTPAFSEEATPTKPAVPLFTATTRSGQNMVPQPITAAPEVVYMARGGLMINVGTGNAFRQGDFGARSVRQSVYGIWDRGQALTAPKLMVRSYTRLPDGSVIPDTQASMNWSADVGYAGWRVDLPVGGEAVLSDPSYDAGIFSFVTTRPHSSEEACNTMPRNSLYMLDPISGKPERKTHGYTEIDGVKTMIAAKDISDPKVRIVSDRRPPPKITCQDGDAGCTCTGSECTKEAPRCAAGQRQLSAISRSTDTPICYSTSPRLQWREIPGIPTAP